MTDRVFLTTAPKMGVWSVVSDSIMSREKALATGSLEVKRSMNLKKFDLQIFRSAVLVLGALAKHLAKSGKLTRISSLKLGDLELGRYVAASALRNVEAQRSKVTLYFRLIESLLRSIFVHAAAVRLSDKVSSIFLGNVYYLDGIWIDFFLRQPHVTVYLELDPHGLVCVNREFPNLSALQEYLAGHDRNTEEKVTQAKTYMARRLKRPAEAIWYYSESNQPLDTKLDLKPSKVAIVVYAHSFTDAQFSFGPDGFLGVYDWLSFTLKELKERDDIDVYVKAHPNFFGTTSASGIAEMDRRLWNRLASEMKSFGFNVVDAAIPNSVFLSNFDTSQTVLISHHGNALVEGAFLGFRCLASRSGPWYEFYSFLDVYNSVATYKEMLANVKIYARTSSQSEFQSCLRYIERFYLNPHGSLGHKYHLNLISGETGLPVKELIKDPFTDLRLLVKDTRRLREEICSAIDVVD